MKTSHSNATVLDNGEERAEQQEETLMTMIPFDDLEVTDNTSEQTSAPKLKLSIFDGVSRLLRNGRVIIGDWIPSLQPARLEGPGTPSNKSANSDISSQQPRILGEFVEISTDMEARFMASASIVEAISANGQTFVSESERLAGMAVGRMDGKEVCAQSRELLEQPLAYLNASHSQVLKLLERLERDRARVDALLGAKDALQRALAPLAYIQMMFKIESASIDDQARAMFSALTLDIETLHGEISALFDTQFSDILKIKNTLGLVISQLRSQAQLISNTIAMENKQICLSLDDLVFQLAENKQRETAISRINKTVSSEIQKIVFGLQFQDIINQRLQHIGGAISRIAARGGSESSQACRLEAEQLEAACEELRKAESSLTNSIFTLMECFSEEDNKRVSADEFDALAESVGEIAGRLLDAISKTSQQVTECVSCSACACETLRPVRSLASGLTGSVRDFSFRMHLMGLNAQIRAAQVGSGAGLEVLSIRICEVSKETNSVSQQIASSLELFVDDLSKSVLECEQFHAIGEQQQALMTREGAAAENALRALRDEARCARLRVAKARSTVQIDSSSALDELEQFHRLNERLDAIRAKLENAAETDSLPSDRLTVGRASLLKEFKNDYSMASEHDVFERAIIDCIPKPQQSRAQKSSRNGIAPVPAPGAEQSWKNVELF